MLGLGNEKSVVHIICIQSHISFVLLKLKTIYDFLNLGFQILEVMSTLRPPEKKLVVCFTESSVSDLGIIWFSIVIFKLFHSALSLDIFLYTENNSTFFFYEQF